MNKLSTAAAIIALIGTPAFAADMAVKAPAPVPAPVYNWTGWYAGVNAGASFGHAKTDFNAPLTTIVSSISAASGIFTTDFAGSDSEYPDGFIGGGQIGYNWQFSPIWVAGLEADFQGAIEKDHTTLTNNFAGSAPGTGLTNITTGSAALYYQTKIDWFGTVRLRAGYVWGNGNVFSYLTGGLAYGKVDVDGTSTSSGSIINALPTPFSITQTFAHNAVNTGWVLGYGTEGVIDFWGARNWTWKVEGLYMDLGTVDTTGAATSSTVTSGATRTATGGPITTHTHFTDGILRGGLNFKFN
jgi:outer membrane immunogenic protein